MSEEDVYDDVPRPGEARTRAPWNLEKSASHPTAVLTKTIAIAIEMPRRDAGEVKLVILDNS